MKNLIERILKGDDTNSEVFCRLSTRALKKTINHVGGCLKPATEFYNNKIKPFAEDAIKSPHVQTLYTEQIKGRVSVMTEFYNQHVKKHVDTFLKTATSLYEKHVQPTVNNAKSSCAPKVSKAGLWAIRGAEDALQKLEEDAGNAKIF